MKTKLIAGVIATCFAAPVLAQSSVTIYGIADAGFMKTKGESAKLVSGIADGSRIGLKGTEDIGGGYKAIFNLEARVELDTGTQSPGLVNPNQGFYLTKGMDAFKTPALASTLATLRAGLQPAVAVNAEKALFDRTAMVGVVTPFGAILVGRMYTPGYEVFAAADAFETGTGGTWGGITGGTAGFTALGADIRSQKSIQYRIATPSGFGGSLMYGTKNSGYLGRYNKFMGGAITYKTSVVDVGVGHNQGEDLQGRKSLTTTTVGGSVKVGDFKFFAGYHDQVNRNSALLADYLAVFSGQVAPGLRAAGVPAANVAALTSIYTTNITRNSQVDASSYQFGLHYRLGQGRIMASAARQNDRTASNSDATLMAVGYDYNLSARTDIYTVLSNIKNQNDGQYTPGGAGSPGGFTKVAGEDSRAIQIGVRHRF
ncbi:porin [Massilia sp. CCM 8733]|uniref:Porin n=1 Tax=Massilia mucilaginosa TaxID=2609282 RepID=A0ABX0P002_9BURK|nr:porin [Massilia mucilaginosa]NHZ92530.1 porin [Massilia mucilaginosa]